jgi:starch phosphorylase
MTARMGKIGGEEEPNDEHQQDEADAASLRQVFTDEVVPLFYDRGKDGIPHAWLKRVRRSIATLIPQFNTHRMVMEYTKKYYLEEKKRG